MTDEPETTLIPFPPKSPPPSPDPIPERGARFAPPPSPQEPPEKIGLFAPEITMRDLMVEILRGDFSRLDWAVAEALRLIDPGERSPPLMRAAARLHLRKLAGEIALNREKPTLRSSASYAVIALAPNRPEPPKQDLTPPKRAEARLEAAKPGRCNLCGQRRTNAREFVLRWRDEALRMDVTSRYCAPCVTRLIVEEHRRREAQQAAREADKEAREAGFSKRDLRELTRDGWDGGVDD
jgi:hypothetical protein